MHLLSVERETQLLNNIARDLAASNELAGQMIRNESLNIFQNGYSSAVGEIKTQLGNVGMSASWSELDRNALHALFNGQDTILGQLKGYQAGFSQVQSLQVWQRNIIGDRRKGTYYYQRAMGRLGDNSEIVRRLQNELAQSLLLGESISQLATRIRGVTQGCRRQAIRIARTECIRALNQGKMLSYYEAQEMGIPLQKRWRSIPDERTRESHVHLDYETVELENPFSNGLMYPCDPNGDASEIINCRCVCVSVVDTSQNQNIEEEQIEEVSEPDLTKQPAIDETEQYKDYTVHNQKAVSEEVSRKVDEIIEKASERFPELATIEKPRLVQGELTKIDGSDTTVVAFYNKEKHTIVFSNRGLAGEVDLYFTAVPNVDGLIAHETAHALNGKRLSEYRTSFETVESAHRKYKYEQDKAGQSWYDTLSWTADISDYARENNNEAFAEAFADWLINGENANSVSIAIMDEWKRPISTFTEEDYRRRGLI